MKLKKPSLIIFTIISLTLGTFGAWFFSTLEPLSRTLKDMTSMLFLVTGLIFAGIFLVLFLLRIKNSSFKSKVS